MNKFLSETSESGDYPSFKDYPRFIKVAAVLALLFGLFALFGIESVYSNMTCGEKCQLEKDLVAIQRSVNSMQETEDYHQNKFNEYNDMMYSENVLMLEAKKEREFHEGRKNDKTCMLARLKKNDGEEVKPETKSICPNVFPMAGRK